MELKAQYDLDDLLDLVEQDLEAKGFRLMGGSSPVINGGEGLLLTLAIELLETRTISPALPALPAPAPAATATRTPSETKPKTKYEMSEKRQEVLRKARAKYAEKKKAEREAEKTEAKHPGRPSAEKLVEKQQTRAQVVAQRVAGDELSQQIAADIKELKAQQHQPEVVAPATSPFQVSELLSSSGLSTGSY